EPNSETSAKRLDKQQPLRKRRWSEETARRRTAQRALLPGQTHSCAPFCWTRSRRAVNTLLEGPSVNVRITEVGEARIVATQGIQPRSPSAGPRLDRVFVSDATDRDATGDQSRSLGSKVGCNEVQIVYAVMRFNSDELH